ncbi:MAG TPA: FUSC family protein [Microbacterium sp.]|nr:FUSC family protein [Microbacterium sp.]
MNPKRGQRRRLRSLVNSGKKSPSAARLVLAVKTAVAAAVAWYLAPYVPLADNDYSYYAPLGVLVSMYPTLAGSARAGVQAIIGLVLGIALGIGGLGLVLLGAPGVVSVAAVICIGILFGGIRALGAGSGWVAIAGLFVLLIGGPAAEEFSVSYLFTMAFGVLVGVLINFVVFPPLYLQRASSRLSTLRDATASALGELAHAITQEPVKPEDIREATSGLAAMLTAVEGEVGEAEESRKGNPRGRRRREGHALMSLRMTAIERTTHSAIELADTLVNAVEDGSLPEIATRHALADATRVCGELVTAPVDDSAADEKIARATSHVDDAVARLNRHADSAETPDYSTAYAYAALIGVRRIVDACREFAAARANT